MGRGWIKVHRKILDNPLWSEKPFTRGQAWIDLLLMANHAPASLMIGAEIIELSAGQLHTSELKLSERWGWSRKKTKLFLKLLENQKMATTVGTTKGTTITIENYSFYQDSGTTEDTAEGTSKEHQKNNEGYTNKKNKNNKNDKKCVYGAPGREDTHTYGKLKNVFLTAEEYREITETYQNSLALIDKVSLWLPDHPRVRNHYAKVLTFARNDNWPRRPKPKPGDEPAEPIEKAPMPEDMRKALGGVFKTLE